GGLIGGEGRHHRHEAANVAGREHGVISLWALFWVLLWCAETTIDAGAVGGKAGGIVRSARPGKATETVTRPPFTLRQNSAGFNNAGGPSCGRSTERKP